MSIHLFCSHADTFAPLLPNGIPIDALASPPLPIREPPPKPKTLANRSGHADALPDQRYGLIVPAGDIGKRLRELVADLLKLRREQQNAELVVYEVAPDVKGEKAMQWVRENYWDQVERDEATLPRYLLILGGPDLVSWDLQQALGAHAFVGRLAFTKNDNSIDEDAYKAYVEKVLRWEREKPVSRAPALFHAVRDGTIETAHAAIDLVKPSIELARKWQKNGTFPARDIRRIEDHDDFLEHASSTMGGLLFSTSHGLGIFNDTAWNSAAEQRMLQGAMKLDADGMKLTGQDIDAMKSFLPGGLWLYFACFGAGTPADSAYRPWLEQLASIEIARGEARRVMRTLPHKDDSAFVAALPQRALAHPEGPLGVIGHVDLAWGWSFYENLTKADGSAARPRAERFQGILRSLVEGHRFGVAHNLELGGFVNETSRSLLSMYTTDAAAAGVDTQARVAMRAELWMQFHDLSAHVLLGDPAARLPIAVEPVGVRQAAKKPARMTFAPPVEMMEAAIMEFFRDETRADDIAARNGISRDELDRWVETFLAGGRKELEQMR